MKKELEVEYDKRNYVARIRSLKQILKHGLILKKVHIVIQFNQEAWLKPYINKNTKLFPIKSAIPSALFQTVF